MDKKDTEYVNREEKEWMNMQQAAKKVSKHVLKRKNTQNMIKNWI